MSSDQAVSGYGVLYGPGPGPCPGPVVPPASRTSKRKYGSPSVRKDTQLLLSKNARLSQACDRCRMKKIKCDGAKPSCSACTKVGFKCRHSDMLSRRGTPKNYTESLEKEVVRLQKLLDETQNSSPAAVPVPEPAKCPVKQTTASKAKSSPFFELPFINDTFHLHENRVTSDGQFIGHATWNVLTSSTSDLSMDVLPNEDDWLLRYLVRQFQLSQDRIPAVLLSKFQNDAILCGKRIQKCTTHFLETSMALIPILNSASWSNDLARIPHTKVVHPAVLLANLLICQWKWSCFSDDSLFTATKIVCLNSSQPLLRLQTLLLAAFYFMGTSGATLLTKCSTAPFASHLLKIAYAEMVNLGLYINSHRLTPVQSHVALNHTERLTTFWCFQFLDSWWTLIQGAPKTNFTSDEFLPPKLSALGNPRLKPFELLLDFVFGCLDGCNLLKAVSQGANTYMVYLLETFRKQLVHFNLYHGLTDHEVHALSTLGTKLDQPLSTEIQITLYYLVVSLFTHAQSFEVVVTKRVTFESDQKDNLELKDDTDFSVKKSDLRKHISRTLISQRDNAYEILTLYYLVMVDIGDSKVMSPVQLKTLHLLPCDNLSLLKVCLGTLASWASSKYAKDEPDYELTFNKCQCIVQAWCNIWYFDETEDELVTRLQKVFQFTLSIAPQKEGQVMDKLLYLHSAKLQYRRALMQNQYGDTSINGNVEEPFNNIYGVDNMAMRVPTLETINALFNPLAMQEEDEGYAEDDDEDDEPFLELPLFKRRQPFQKQVIAQPQQPPQPQQQRSSSLFDHRQPGPIPRRISGDGKQQSDELNALPKEDDSIKGRIGFGEKWPNEHYLLVQDLQKPSPAVGTPRSLADLLCPSSEVSMPTKLNDSSNLSIT
ncbi:LAME_0A05446g1_1 [Lachancea meyersii CBS 8951]|uniref:LAME_0A05446g1_1 n=1 Tax=Lachancea meyersii CBS 8951 TaxID=1266667 RepID=A0A1G4IPS7_9SACH|nr:LAME_0A05446g1_1 [Lachancea meyersii CBS 8951]